MQSNNSLSISNQKQHLTFWQTLSETDISEVEQDVFNRWKKILSAKIWCTWKVLTATKWTSGNDCIHETDQYGDCGSIMVGGGISGWSRTDLAIHGNLELTGVSYRDDILTQHVQPFVRVLQDVEMFQHEINWPHTVLVCAACFTDCRVTSHWLAHNVSWSQPDWKSEHNPVEQDNEDYESTNHYPV